MQACDRLTYNLVPRAIWPYYVKWKFLTFCGLSRSRSTTKKISKNWLFISKNHRKLIFVKITSRKIFWSCNNHFLSLTLIVNFNCSFFQTSAMKILKYEQLKFTINVNNKKWLFHDQKNFFDVIFTKIQFSMIFGKKNSVFAIFLP